jgi:hypothetical protein
LPRTERRKELLMLLAQCKPVKLLNKPIHGGNYGPFEKIRAGNQTEACIERASA